MLDETVPGQHHADDCGGLLYRLSPMAHICASHKHGVVAPRSARDHGDGMLLYRKKCSELTRDPVKHISGKDRDEDPKSLAETPL